MGTEKGLAVVESLASLSAGNRFAVCTYREQNVQDCFESRIKQAAERLEIPLVRLADWRRDPLAIIAKYQARAVFCIGWKYLVSDEVVKAVGGNVIIAHDSLLPKFRGFSPLPSALISGVAETGVTFLKADVSVDSGPVLWQAAVAIDNDDYISDLIRKIVPLYVEGVRTALTTGFMTERVQDSKCATYSIWRDFEDYRLDWTQPADTLRRTVRALASPYLGARTAVSGREVVVHKCTALQDLRFEIRQPGKVWSLDAAGRPEVICGEGMLRIDEACYVDGTPLIPMARLRVRFE